MDRIEDKRIAILAADGFEQSELMVPKQRLENRRFKLEYTFGPAITASRSDNVRHPLRSSRISSRLASEYERWFEKITTGRLPTSSRGVFARPALRLTSQETAKMASRRRSLRSLTSRSWI